MHTLSMLGESEMKVNPAGKIKVKLDITELWCCNTVQIRPFPASYIMKCPNCGTKKPSQITQRYY